MIEFPELKLFHGATAEIGMRYDHTLDNARDFRIVDVLEDIVLLPDTPSMIRRNFFDIFIGPHHPKRIACFDMGIFGR